MRKHKQSKSINGVSEEDEKIELLKAEQAKPYNGDTASNVDVDIIIDETDSKNNFEDELPISVLYTIGILTMYFRHCMRQEGKCYALRNYIGLILLISTSVFTGVVWPLWLISVPDLLYPDTQKDDYKDIFWNITHIVKEPGIMGALTIGALYSAYSLYHLRSFYANKIANDVTIKLAPAYLKLLKESVPEKLEKMKLQVPGISELRNVTEKYFLVTIVLSPIYIDILFQSALLASKYSPWLSLMIGIPLASSLTVEGGKFLLNKLQEKFGKGGMVASEMDEDIIYKSFLDNVRFLKARNIDPKNLLKENLAAQNFKNQIRLKRNAELTAWSINLFNVLFFAIPGIMFIINLSNNETYKHGFTKDDIYFIAATSGSILAGCCGIGNLVRDFLDVAKAFRVHKKLSVSKIYDHIPSSHPDKRITLMYTDIPEKNGNLVANKLYLYTEQGKIKFTVHINGKRKTFEIDNTDMLKGYEDIVAVLLDKSKQTQLTSVQYRAISDITSKKIEPASNEKCPSNITTKKWGKENGSYFFKDVSLKTNGKLRVKNLNFVIKPGQITAIIGASGAGKSSIIDLITKFAKPSGEIYFFGKNLEEKNFNKYSRKIFHVEQAPPIFEFLTLEENLTMGITNTTDPHVISDIVSDAKIILNEILFADVDEKLGKRCAHLSGGEKQKVGITRALLSAKYNNTQVFIFDECTSNLDNISQKKVMNKIKELKENKKATVILIAHRLETIDEADRVIIMKKEEIENNKYGVVCCVHDQTKNKEEEGEKLCITYQGLKGLKS